MSVVAAAIAAGGGLISAGIGANAANSAASEQESTAQQALGITQANEAPYLNAGSQSLAMLMQDLQGGTFGAGSIPAFTAPTLAQAEGTPGYQFAQTQGDQGILEGSAASGGSISGGTLKALDNYNSNLAQTDYNNVFNQNLSTYQAALTGQNQAFNQLLAPAQLGASATQSNNSTVSQLLQSLGASQAAGTVGSANAISSGVASATNGATNAISLSQLGQLLTGGNFGSPAAATPATSSVLGLSAPAAGYSPTFSAPSIAPAALPISSNDFASLPPG